MNNTAYLYVGLDYVAVTNLFQKKMFIVYFQNLDKLWHLFLGGFVRQVTLLPRKIPPTPLFLTLLVVVDDNHTTTILQINQDFL